VGDQVNIAELKDYDYGCYVRDLDADMIKKMSTAQLNLMLNMDYRCENPNHMLKPHIKTMITMELHRRTHTYHWTIVLPIVLMVIATVFSVLAYYRKPSVPAPLSDSVAVPPDPVAPPPDSVAVPPDPVVPLPSSDSRPVGNRSVSGK